MSSRLHPSGFPNDISEDRQKYVAAQAVVFSDCEPGSFRVELLLKFWPSHGGYLIALGKMVHDQDAGYSWQWIAQKHPTSA
jgi:hypothetical protein